MPGAMGNDDSAVVSSEAISASQCRSTWDVDLFDAIPFIGNVLMQQYGVPVNFSIAGSYAAAYVAKCEFGMDLCYNDVDVFVMADQLPKEILEALPTSRGHGYYSKMKHWSILDVSYVEKVFPQSNVSLNIIILQPDTSMDIHQAFGIVPAITGIMEARLANLLESFDINAVQVGVNVYWWPSVERWGINIASWTWTKAFEAFTRTRTLCIVSPTLVTCPASSILRLVFKSSQLRLNIKLPSPSDVHKLMSDSLIGASAYSKWDSLPQVIKNLPHFEGLAFYGPFQKSEHPDRLFPLVSARFYYIESLLKTDKTAMSPGKYKFEWYANCRSGVTGIKHYSGQHFIRVHPCTTDRTV
jgi:hypothetical protein